MRVLLIENNIVKEDISNLFDTIEDAKSSYNDDSLNFVEVDNRYIMPGWSYENGIFKIPEKYRKAYDCQTNSFYPHDQYREILHQRTSNDTLQALRKLREGDQSYDWQTWLDKLDAYNKAIEDTQLQETYPDKVVYPEYPQR